MKRKDHSSSQEAVRQEGPQPPAPTEGGQAGEPRWVLMGTYRAGPHQGQPQFHMADGAIGPASTSDLSQAQQFHSREAACASIGFRHWSSALEPVREDEARAAIAEAEGRS